MPKCDDIRGAVSKYNSGESFRYDLALRAALGTVEGLPPSLGRSLTEVCLVADWGSIPLNGFSFEDRVAMAGEIETSWPVLQPMRSLRDEDWSTETAMIARAVDALAFTRLLPTPGAKCQLSFLSKYLHWCVNAAFPIWDRNARTALDSDKHEGSWASYSEWLSRVRQEAAAHRDCCLERVRLPGESPLRTLDKALYTIGAEILAHRNGAATPATKTVSDLVGRRVRFRGWSYKDEAYVVDGREGEVTKHGRSYLTILRSDGKTDWAALDGYEIIPNSPPPTDSPSPSPTDL